MGSFDENICFLEAAMSCAPGRPAQLLALLLALPALSTAQTPPDLAPWQPVATLLGSAPLALPGHVRFNFPRTDVTVRIGGTPLDPGLLQVGWIGMAGRPDSALVLGDLALLPTEVPAVAAMLQAHGFEVTALHNHVLGEQPTLVFLHVGAVGPALPLAASLDSALRVTGTPRPVRPLSGAGAVDSAVVATGLGLPGRVRGAVFQASVLLVPDTLRWHDRVVPSALALTSPINLQQTGHDHLVGTGDFTLSGAQLSPVLQALSGPVRVTAVHSHLVGESPRVLYLHFWADGSTTAVTAALHAAILAARRVHS